MRAALETVTGVKKIEVRFDDKEVDVTLDGGTDREALVNALAGAGYPGATVK